MDLVSKKDPAIFDNRDSAIVDNIENVVDEASSREKEGTKEESNRPSNDEQTRRSASKPSNGNAAEEMEERKERARRLMADQNKTTLNLWNVLPVEIILQRYLANKIYRIERVIMFKFFLFYCSFIVIQGVSKLARLCRFLSLG